MFQPQVTTLIRQIQKTLIQKEANVPFATNLCNSVQQHRLHNLSGWIVGIAQNQHITVTVSQKLQKVLCQSKSALSLQRIPLHYAAD